MNLLDVAKELDADPTRLFMLCVNKDLLDVGVHWQLQLHDVDVPERNLERLRAIWYEESAKETLSTMEGPPAFTDGLDAEEDP